MFVFPKEVCQACPRKDECTNARNTGRCISAGPYEEYLQEARKIQKTEEFRSITKGVCP
ncbi:transposase [Candidatus Aerophobetes bacterium]|nr:transposase [Candidatus Aerophobetes bacterium]